MLRFFRAIRKKLIEKDKVRKYLLYAIGEIILVVIGILIALQVNSWNEDRKKLILRKNYSRALLSDFKSDTLRIQQHLNRVYVDSNRIADIEVRLQADEATYDTIAHIFRYEFKPLISSFSVDNTNLNSLITTGDIGLYPDSIRTELTTLARLQAQSLQNNASSLDKYLTVINETTLEFPLDNYFVDMHPKFRDDIWNSADTLKMAGAIDRVLDWKQVYNMNEIRFFSLLLRETTSAIHTLNQLEDLK